MHILKHDKFFDLMLCRIASGIEKRSWDLIINLSAHILGNMMC